MGFRCSVTNSASADNRAHETKQEDVDLHVRETKKGYVARIFKVAILDKSFNKGYNI